MVIEPMETKPRFDAFVFDLDGTLLDTVDDLVVLINMALDDFGYPPRTREDVLSFVGRGAKSLIHRAVPDGTPEETADQVMQHWVDLHHGHDDALTHPFPGIVDVLTQLRAQGCKTAVLSNKADWAVRKIVDQCLPGLFDAVHGEGPDYPRKPNPQGMFATLEELGVEPQRAVYIGDSPVDVLVAREAGMYAVAVLWGYRPYEEFIDRDAAPDVFVDCASDLLAFAAEASA